MQEEKIERLWEVNEVLCRHILKHKEHLDKAHGTIRDLTANLKSAEDLADKYKQMWDKAVDATGDALFAPRINYEEGMDKTEAWIFGFLLGAAALALYLSVNGLIK